MTHSILIIGAGVSGLSCGIRLREAGYDAHIWARGQLRETTSSVAAAVWFPYKAYPVDQVLGWSAATYAELARLSGDPATGIVMRAGVELFDHHVDGEAWWRTAVPSYRRVTEADLLPGFVDGYALTAPVVEMPSYLHYLTQRFAGLGGQIETRHELSLDAALAEAEVVINCAGLGARELVQDRQMIPIRGQVLRVSRVDIEQFTLADAAEVTYIIPRINDCILGGTAQEGNEDQAVDPPTAQAILERCIALEPRLRHAKILEQRVGLRPGRPAVRLEAEAYGSNRRVIHNYGHGGAGVTLSWGCADEVLRRVGRSVV